MPTNGFEPVDVSRANAEHASGRALTPYQNDYQATIGPLADHYSLTRVSGPSSFRDGDHVSQLVSPETGFSSDQWVPASYVQMGPHLYAWPTVYQNSTFPGREDYQTATLPALTNPALRNQNSWGYANGPSAMPTIAALDDNQTSFSNATEGNTIDRSIYNGGSFSSTGSVSGSFSSTFSASIGDNAYFPDGYPPRAFHNSTPFDRTQELPSSPPSPGNYFASSASSPTTVPQTRGFKALRGSPQALPSDPSRRRTRTSSKTRKKLPNKQSGGRDMRKRSSPPPLPRPAAVGKNRAIAPAPPPPASPRRSRNTRSSSMFTYMAVESDQQRQAPQNQPIMTRQAQLHPVLTAGPPNAALGAQFPAPSPVASPAASPSPSQVPDSLTTRLWSYEDQLLVQHRQSGMGYSQIKQLCGFKEAVSTLRGRYRTLTKPKEARVRKPAWTERDLRLLEQGVRAFTAGSSDLRTAKVPWMRVAAYIKDNGGYHFGNSTCRKRWDELLAAEVAAGKDPTRPFYQQ